MCVPECLHVSYVATVVHKWQGVILKVLLIARLLVMHINTGGIVRQLAKDGRINIQLLS